MARNEEKQFGRLNRLILQREKEEQLKKNPPRPRLDTLSTPEEIKKWIPSLQRDIDFNLKQSQVPCYPESKIKEYRDNVDKYEHLYKAFLKKLKTLDPTVTEGDTPWNDRPYHGKKRPPDENAEVKGVNTSSTTEEKFAKLQKIETPLLDMARNMTIVRDENKETNLNVNYDLLDKPLDFKAVFTKANNRKYDMRKCFSDKAEVKLQTEPELCKHSEPQFSVPEISKDKSLDECLCKVNNLGDESVTTCNCRNKPQLETSILPSCIVFKEALSVTTNNCLGLDYDSSSGSDSEDTGHVMYR